MTADPVTEPTPRDPIDVLAALEAAAGMPLHAEFIEGAEPRPAVPPVPSRPDPAAPPRREPQQTGTFTGMEVLTGTLDGHKGTFVVEERGSFNEDNTVHCTFEVVPGSGTGELAGLRGTGSFTARHGEPSVRYTFAYELG